MQCSAVQTKLSVGNVIGLLCVNMSVKKSERGERQRKGSIGKGTSESHGKLAQGCQLPWRCYNETGNDLIVDFISSSAYYPVKSTNGSLPVPLRSYLAIRLIYHETNTVNEFNFKTN